MTTDSELEAERFIANLRQFYAGKAMQFRGRYEIGNMLAHRGLHSSWSESFNLSEKYKKRADMLDIVGRLLAEKREASYGKKHVPEEEG